MGLIGPKNVCCLLLATNKIFLSIQLSVRHCVSCVVMQQHSLTDGEGQIGKWASACSAVSALVGELQDIQSPSRDEAKSEKASQKKASLCGDTPHTTKVETDVMLRQSQVLLI